MTNKEQNDLSLIAVKAIMRLDAVLYGIERIEKFIHNNRAIASIYPDNIRQDSEFVSMGAQIALNILNEVLEEELDEEEELDNARRKIHSTRR